MPAADLFVVAHTKQAVTEMERLRMAAATAGNSIVAMGEMAAAALLLAGGSMWMATNAAADWHQSMVNAAAIGGLTTDQMWELADASVEAGKQMGIASSEIAEGYLELTRAGFSDMNDIMTMNNIIMRAAIANQISYGEAAEVVIKSINAFGIGVEGAYEATAVMQYVANQTLAEFSTFADVMRYAGSTSHFAGLQFNELASMMGVLTDIAMEAGIGARGLNQMLLDMIKNADEFQEFAQRMGVEIQVFAEDGSLNLTEIITKFGELGLTMDVLQESAGEFNVRALRAWLGLISNTERYNELLAGTTDASQYFTDTYLAQLANINIVIGMIGEEFLAIFRNKETLDLLTDFFWQIREWAAEGGARQVGRLMDIFMKAATAYMPILLDIFTNLMAILEDISPTLLTMAELFLRLADSGLLRMYIVLSLMSPLWNSMMMNMQFTMLLLPELIRLKREQAQAEVDLQVQMMFSQNAMNIANAQTEVYIITLQRASLVIQSVTFLIGSLVGALFTGVMAIDMWNSSAGRWGKLMAGLIFMLGVLNVTLAIFNMLKAMSMAPTPGTMLAIGAGVALAMYLGSQALSKDLKASQKKRMEESKEESRMAQEEWSAQVASDVPTAQKGMWRTREGLLYVHDDELVLPPGPAERLRRGGGVAGFTQNIIIGDNVVIGITDLEDRIRKAAESGFSRSMSRGGQYI